MSLNIWRVDSWWHHWLKWWTQNTSYRILCICICICICISLSHTESLTGGDFQFKTWELHVNMETDFVTVHWMIVCVCVWGGGGESECDRQRHPVQTAVSSDLLRISSNEHWPVCVCVCVCVWERARVSLQSCQQNKCGSDILWHHWVDTHPSLAKIMFLLKWFWFCLHKDGLKTSWWKSSGFTLTEVWIQFWTVVSDCEFTWSHSLTVVVIRDVGQLKLRHVLLVTWTNRSPHCHVTWCHCEQQDALQSINNQ